MHEHVLGPQWKKANKQELETGTTAVKNEPAMALTPQKAASGPKTQSSSSPAQVDTQRSNKAMRSRTSGRGDP